MSNRPDKFADACREIERLRVEIPMGSKWQHVNGSVYRVNSVVLIEADLTPAVCYSMTDDFDIPWVRPAQEFLERFARIGSPIGY